MICYAFGYLDHRQMGSVVFRKFQIPIWTGIEKSGLLLAPKVVHLERAFPSL